MPRRPVPPLPSASIAIACAGSVVTVTCGEITRRSACASPASAKGLASRLRNDSKLARRWMQAPESEQLGLPLDVARRVLEVPTSGATPAAVSGGLIEEG